LSGYVKWSCSLNAPSALLAVKSCLLLVNWWAMVVGRSTQRRLS
jgi:hypothetical protein